MRTIIEPFKIKSVEPLSFTTLSQREEILKKAFYNLFSIKAEHILIDLLTDSGTAAMSVEQWAHLMSADESYAGSRSFYRFQEVIEDIMGMPHVIPTHQGRAAERILFSTVIQKDDCVPANTHFDTTRANIEFNGGRAIDLALEVSKKPSYIHPFKGNIDTLKLKDFIEEVGPHKIPLCVLTITNNTGGGQPVSLANIKETKKILKPHGIPLFIDAARFAENAYFIKLREEGCQNKSVKEIVKEVFSYADGILMSAKKDGFGNIGGFLAFKDEAWIKKTRNLLILTEGFTTYGGMAGRDLEAIAQGLIEVLDEDYLKYRIRSIEYFGEKLLELDVPIIQPPGGHAIYIDAKGFLPHIPPSEFPGQALLVELYRQGGIRGVEIGSSMFGKMDELTKKEVPSDMELVRLALPRRVYTQSHVDYVIEVIENVCKTKHLLRGYRIIEQEKYLRHFTAKFAPL